MKYLFTTFACNTYYINYNIIGKRNVLHSVYFSSLEIKRHEVMLFACKRNWIVLPSTFLECNKKCTNVAYRIIAVSSFLLKYKY